MDVLFYDGFVECRHIKQLLVCAENLTTTPSAARTRKCPVEAAAEGVASSGGGAEAAARVRATIDLPIAGSTAGSSANVASACGAAGGAAEGPVAAVVGTVAGVAGAAGSIAVGALQTFSGSAFALPLAGASLTGSVKAIVGGGVGLELCAAGYPCGSCNPMVFIRDTMLGSRKASVSIGALWVARRPPTRVRALWKPVLNQ